MSRAARCALFAAAALGLFACTPSSAPAPEPAEELPPDSRVAPYKGYEAVNQVLLSRFILQPTSFQLSDYFGESGAELATLLGAWRGDGLHNQFANGAPNAMSFVIWRVAFSALGRDVAALCPSGGGLTMVQGLLLRPDAAEAVGHLCEWPKAEAQTDGTLLTLWSSLVGYDAPYEDYAAWRDHFYAPVYQPVKPEKVIPLIISSALLNPHLLLRN